MKSKFYLQIGLLLLLIISCFGCSEKKSTGPSDGDALTVYATQELFDLTTKWADIYSTKSPEVDIIVTPLSESMLTNNLDNNSNLIFVSEDYDALINERSFWKVVVGRDIIVPVINSENPAIKEINGQGISPLALASIFDDKESASWGALLDTELTTPVNVYVTEDASINAGMAKLFNKDQVKFGGTYAKDTKELLAAVQGDPNAIGICKITDVMVPESFTLQENVKLLPIDVNGNGQLDYKENVYSDMEAFARGVWIGKYPGALSRNLYSISSEQPSTDTELAFLKWIITGGQALLDGQGYSYLEQNEQLAQVRWIEGIGAANSNDGHTSYASVPGVITAPYTRALSIILAVFFGIAMAVVIFFAVIRILERRRSGFPVRQQIPRLAFNEDFLKSPAGLYFDKTHTWAFLDKDGMVKIGIDEFLQQITGPLTRVKMKSPGTKVRKGSHVVSIIQDGKQLDICSPVSGIIREQNEVLLNNTSMINSSPYTEGWVYKIEPLNWLQEVQFYIMGTSYKEWLKTEFSRLKEFISESMNPGTEEYAHVLQDGGELKNRILEDLGPEVWDDFQTNFMDVSA